jgi:hypothetical protein
MSEAVPVMPPAWAGEPPATDAPECSDATDAAVGDAAVETARAEPAPEYVGRRRARPVVLGFRDGSELALEAGTPAARALRAMATALGASDGNTA